MTVQTGLRHLVRQPKNRVARGRYFMTNTIRSRLESTICERLDKIFPVRLVDLKELILSIDEVFRPEYLEDVIISLQKSGEIVVVDSFMKANRESAYVFPKGYFMKGVEGFNGNLL